MKYTIKALNPVYKGHINTIISTITGLPGIQAVSLDFNDQYYFIFTCEYDKEADISSIMEQIKLLLRLYASTILTIDTELLLTPDKCPNTKR